MDVEWSKSKHKWSFKQKKCYCIIALLVLIIYDHSKDWHITRLEIHLSHICSNFM